MPEHIHFIIDVGKASEYHLGDFINHFKRECFSRCGQTLFQPGYHDRILWKKNQLKRMSHYISDNPRRRLMRMQTPTFFRRGIFTDKENRTFSWYGNPDLLEEADITAVKVSSKYKPEYLLHRKRIWHRTILSGGVLVSPFVSPHEAKVRDWARENGGRFIIILDNGFPERFTPKGWMHDFCAQGRLLLIGPEEYQSESPKRGKSYWESMNKLAFEIAGEDFWEGY